MKLFCKFFGGLLNIQGGKNVEKFLLSKLCCENWLFVIESPVKLGYFVLGIVYPVLLTWSIFHFSHKCKKTGNVVSKLLSPE